MIRTNKSVFFSRGILAAVFLGFTILSCSQDSIFYDISNEPEPKSPRITGNPTSLALVKNQVFVGSRMGNSIYSFGRDLQWTALPAFDGAIGDLATDGEHLYALVFPRGNPLASSTIRRFNIGANAWDTEFSSDAYNIQTLYGADGKIFAGGMLRSDFQKFAILLLDSSAGSMTVIKENTSLLRGAASMERGKIFLATAGSGVFRYHGGEIGTASEKGTANAALAGIIATSGTVVAVSSVGMVYFLNTLDEFTSYPTGFLLTGAMSLWSDRENQWRPSLLLIGVRGTGSSISHGYREILLDRAEFPTLTVKVPGDDAPTSVVNRARYTASIGQLPVEAILQLPDISRGGPLDYNAYTSDPNWEPIIFAGTSKNGLWSYRDGVWNAEE